jgi:hypothetical protein
MSLELKFFTVYHCSMMALLLFGGMLSLKFELLITMGLAAVFITLSQKRRLATGWRWHKPGSREYVWAVLSVPLGGAFLYAATPQFPPSDPRFLPWYLGGLGIFVFNDLTTLNVVRMSEVDFINDCQEPSSQIGALQEEPSAPELLWKKIVRWTFSILFFVVWLEFLAFFYYFGVSFKGGSPTPTITRTELLTNHGETRYVKPEEKKINDWLEATATVGIPAMMLAGVILHFVVGVRIIKDAPTLKKWWRQHTES